MHIWRASRHLVAQSGILFALFLEVLLCKRYTSIYGLMPWFNASIVLSTYAEKVIVFIKT